MVNAGLSLSGLRNRSASEEQGTVSIVQFPLAPDRWSTRTGRAGGTRPPCGHRTRTAPTRPGRQPSGRSALDMMAVIQFRGSSTGKSHVVMPISAAPPRPELSVLADVTSQTPSICPSVKTAPPNRQPKENSHSSRLDMGASQCGSSEMSGV